MQAAQQLLQSNSLKKIVGLRPRCFENSKTNLQPIKREFNQAAHYNIQSEFLAEFKQGKERLSKGNWLKIQTTTHNQSRPRSKQAAQCLNQSKLWLKTSKEEEGSNQLLGTENCSNLFKKTSMLFLVLYFVF